MAQNPEMASLGAGAIGGALAAIGTVFIIFTVLIGALMIVSRWRIFEKAKLPGRGALIPIYNVYLMFKLAGKPEWTRRLLLPPVAGVLAIVAQFKISKKFGKTDNVCCGALVSTIYFLSNPCFLRRSKIQSRGITLLLKTAKKILIVPFGQLFFTCSKKKKIWLSH